MTSHYTRIFYCNKYGERIERLSQQDKLSKFCMGAAFVHVVEVGQYFMTKDTGDFRQFRAVACREYTLLRDDESSQPRGWIQGNTRIGPVLEVTASYLWGKHGIEIRIWSLSQDNSHSWVRISQGTNKHVVDFKLQQHRSSCRSTGRTSVTIECEGYCSQIQGKSKTTKKENLLIYRASFR